MKTPRELLLGRHEAAESKLDAIRQNVMSEHLAECGRPRPQQAANVRASNQFMAALYFLRSCARGRAHSGGILAKLWQELVWPCRRIWTGIAAVWLVILVFNFATRERDLIVVENTPPTPEMAAALKNQRQMMAQLLNSDTTAQPSRLSLPKPRSEQRQAVVSV